MTESSREIIFVVGATAVGKSDIGLHLARRLNAAVLVMDSMQVYRGADIGTSKPSAAERREIAHGGIDLVEIGEEFHVRKYLDHARLFLDRCEQIGQPVVVVGGTGLYYRALTQGLCGAPPAAKELREKLVSLTLEELQTWLRHIDPQIVPHIDVRNPRRVTRAIEVMETTGTSLRDWQEANEPPLVSRHRTFFIQREKEDLHLRIAARVDHMLTAGWLTEVRELLQKHGSEVLAKFPAIGYPNLARWIERGEDDLEPVRNDIILATRQYAKRQLTWFRRESNLVTVLMAKNDLSTDVAERLL